MHAAALDNALMSARVAMRELAERRVNFFFTDANEEEEKKAAAAKKR